MTRRSGFTLIELLIVVAIIAILAAIAVPNFLEAQTRSKVSRTRADMRTVAVAIEAYSVDNNKYPWVNTITGFALPQGGHQLGPVFLAGMTSPIAYLTSLMKDPFGGRKAPDDPYHQAGFNTTFEYWYWTEEYCNRAGWSGGSPTQKSNWWHTSGPGTDAPGCLWSLMSQGPDLHWTHATHSAGAAAEVDRALVWQYDSTNGTISWGNIVRVGP